jgi:hypothetical protein
MLGASGNIPQQFHAPSRKVSEEVIAVFFAICPNYGSQPVPYIYGLPGF